MDFFSCPHNILAWALASALWSRLQRWSCTALRFARGDWDLATSQQFDSGETAARLFELSA